MTYGTLRLIEWTFLGFANLLAAPFMMLLYILLGAIWLYREMASSDK